MTRTRAWWMLLAVTGLGCSRVHEPTDAPGSPDAAAPSACITHGDCEAGLYCDAVSSGCAVSASCAGDDDCAAPGFWCDFRRTCVPHAADACRETTDCGTAALCIEGRCTPLEETCQYIYDCPTGSACVDAHCVAVCTTDADCALGTYCDITHFCVPTHDCASSATCPSAQHCVDGRCLAECNASETCAVGARGTAYCAADSFCHPSWQAWADCPAETCAFISTCVLHRCRVPCPTMSDAECAAIDSALPYCLLDPRSGLYLCYAEVPTVAECRTSADCRPAAPTCVNANCQ